MIAYTSCSLHHENAAIGQLIPVLPLAIWLPLCVQCVPHGRRVLCGSLPGLVRSLGLDSGLTYVGSDASTNLGNVN